MRASKSKRQRKDGQAAALEAQRQAQRGKRRRIVIVTAALVLAAALLATGIGLTASGYLAARVTAATVDGHRLTGVELCYFYREAYQTFAAENPAASQTLNPALPFDQQVFSQEQDLTWADYFLQEAAKLAADTYRVYDAAVAAGFTLSEASQQRLESNRASLESVPALLPDCDSADDYIRANYGRGCTLESYMDYARIRLTASDYAQYYSDSLQYDDATVAAAYAAAPEDYDTVSYKIYYSSVVDGQNEDGTVHADMALSEANARRMAEECRGDLERFNEMTVELSAEKRKSTYSDPNFSLRDDVTVSGANDKLRAWLTDPARQYGDTTYVQADERGYYVGFFLDYKDNDFDLCALRQITFRAYADADNADDPDGMLQARQRAEEALADFESGPRTAEAFTELAGEKSSLESLLSPYVPGTLDGAVDRWCYDEPRTAGDYAMLRGSTGYYLVYLDGFGGGLYRDYLVDQALRTADYDAWYEGVTAGDPAELHSTGVFFMGK